MLYEYFAGQLKNTRALLKFIGATALKPGFPGMFSQKPFSRQSSNNRGRETLWLVSRKEPHDHNTFQMICKIEHFQILSNRAAQPEALKSNYHVNVQSC